jgi:alginate O-acetyltransferase complex protein AlgJ
MVPVPAKCVIYPDKLSHGASLPQKIGETDRAFSQVLRERGIKVLDLTDTFLTARANLPEALYCRQDSHWSPAGVQVAAKEIALRLQDLPWVKDQPKVPMKSEALPLEIRGDLAPPDAPPETTEARFISAAGSGQPIPPSKESPLTLLGDSHNLIFHAGGDMQSVGAGLPDQLAFELGFPVDVVAVRGSGATPARRNLARRKDNLAGRHLVVWCFSSREFTEGQGWAKVPVIKPPAQSGP